MPKINEAYVEFLRKSLPDKEEVEEFIKNAPITETEEERCARLEGQYAEYYQARLNNCVGRYYRNISQMDEVLKEKYKEQLERLKKEIASIRDDLLKFYLIMPIRIPAWDEKAADKIIYELHLLLREEVVKANNALKQAMQDGKSLEEYFISLSETQEKAFEIAMKYGGSFHLMYQTIDEADPYEELLYK